MNPVGHAVVFGGSRGIGLATARRFAREGFDVTVLSRSERSVNCAVDLIGQDRRKDGQVIKGLVCDVGDQESIEKSFQALRNDTGSLDVLVNSAATNVDNLLIKTRHEDVLNQINVNLIGTISTCRLVTKMMLRQSTGGSVINIGSIVGTNGNAGQTIYAATKSALVGFTRSLAKEVARKGITANVITPGFIDTEFVNQDQKSSMIKHIPLQRLGTAEEVAEVALFLHKSRYITGQVITIDGGLSMSI